MIRLFVAVLFSVVLAGAARAANAFATDLVRYDPGAGAVPNFTNPATALGEPSRVNPFGEPTDPFNPPYGTNQIVSLGAGGWLIARFQTPVLNHPRNHFGLDFTVFGNTGFIITNDFDFTTFDWVGTPATDGSLFGAATGLARVAVSRDGVNYFALDPARAPALDNFPPTDGAGDFQLPLAPELSAPDFSGATLADIRALYAGSAGGASFDISWALDDEGRPVFLPEIRFVRIDVLSGRLEIDGFAVVSREPAARP